MFYVAVYVQSAVCVCVCVCVCVSSEQWIMGNAVQCDVGCESQYDGEATSCGSRTEGHEPDS